MAKFSYNQWDSSRSVYSSDKVNKLSQLFTKTRVKKNKRRETFLLMLNTYPVDICIHNMFHMACMYLRFDKVMENKGYKEIHNFSQYISAHRCIWKWNEIKMNKCLCLWNKKIKKSVVTNQINLKNIQYQNFLW
jgi:hypothetical protein